MKPPVILVFDSGVGGLTVFREIKAALPGASYVYVADDAFFPYGFQPEDALVARVVEVFGSAIADYAPDLIVNACNTASTIALTALRERYKVPIVGTVPAIKPACAQSKTRRVAVLGTLATVSREYTRTLIREFAAGCDVGLVGSSHLATYAEAELNGSPATDDSIKAEIAPCFIDTDGRRTDTVDGALPRCRAVAGRMARSRARDCTPRRRSDRHACARRNAGRAAHGFHVGPYAVADAGDSARRFRF
jgi:glutamate racemase